MNNDKLQGQEPELQSEFGKKLDNFWYYNKWKVIAAIFVIFVLTVCIIQIATREKSDVSVLYGGAVSSSNEITLDMKSALSDIEPSSVGKNGIKLSVMEIYDNDFVVANKINPGLNSANYKNLCSLIATGEYSLLILDKWIYDELKSEVGFCNVESICGSIAADKKLDDFAVYLKKTDFYNSYQGSFAALADDTLVCLCIYAPIKTVVGCTGSDGDRDYQDSVEMFKTIVNYNAQ